MASSSINDLYQALADHEALMSDIAKTMDQVSQRLKTVTKKQLPHLIVKEKAHLSSLKALYQAAVDACANYQMKIEEEREKLYIM